MKLIVILVQDSALSHGLKDAKREMLQIYPKTFQFSSITTLMLPSTPQLMNMFFNWLELASPKIQLK